MIDREHDSINWGAIILLFACAYYWVNVYYYGFFVSTMWTIVIAAIAGIIIKIKENRY